MSDISDPAPSEGPLLVAAGTPGNERFGSLLKDLRERSGMTPQQLADQAAVHVSFVRGIERGAQAPSVATAKPLLACMKEQDRIEWTDEGPTDLLIWDPTAGRSVAFEFKAKVHGQNRRKDIAGARVGLSLLAEVMSQLPDVVTGAGSGGSTGPEVGDGHSSADECIGRIVRLLASADEQALAEIEELLVSRAGRPRK